MRKKRTRRGPLVLGAIFILAVIIPCSLHPETKDFRFPGVRIEIRVAKDGSFSVDELRTYSFKGTFSWATLWIPLKVSRGGYSYKASIEDFQVLDENGDSLRMAASEKGDVFSAKWYYSARDTVRTFNIRYRVKGGITSYPDVTELYWQVVGDKWDKPTDSFTATVVLPEAVSNKDDILVYGHGPLTGWSEIVDERTAKFSASDIPPGQFVEIRMI